jgi:hypothetical protein
MDVSFPEEIISEAVRILNRCDIAYSEDDDFAGRFIVVSQQRFDAFLDNVADDRSNYDKIIKDALDDSIGLSRAEDANLPYLEAYNRFPVLRKYSQFGEEWLNRALEGIRAQSSLETAAIPASDRVVRIDHNDPQAVQIRESAEQLKQRILRGNDLGNISPEQAEAVSREIEELQNSFAGGVIRPQAVADRAKKTLRWVGEKAAGTLVGKGALALLTLLLSFLGLT